MADLKISQLTGATTPLAGTEVLPIVQSGSTVKVSVANLTAGRAVGMAGGSFTDNITQSTAAKGVNFTANTPAAGMTSQLLNWYEEGTWTPTDGSGAGLTLTVNGTATYTRIGRQVTVIGSVTYPNTANTANMIISGLPYAVAAGTYASIGSIGYTSIATTVLNYLRGTASYFQGFRPGANVKNSEMSNGQLDFSLTYFTA